MSELTPDYDPIAEGDDGLCECGEQSWEMCDCGRFFLEWMCGYDPSTGLCSMAGSEDCDWECPRSRAPAQPQESSL